MPSKALVKPQRAKAPAKRKRTTKRPDCTGRTLKGDPCKNKAMAGRTVCKQHSKDPDIGRPPALTAAKKDKVLQALRAGAWKRDAATYAGVSERTLHAYLEAGRQALDAGTDNEFSQFLQSVEGAQVGVKILATGAIIQAIRGVRDKEGNVIQAGDWRAAIALLERMFPNEYGRRDAKLIELTGNIGIEDLTAGHQPVDLPLEARERIAQVLTEFDVESTAEEVP